MSIDPTKEKQSCINLMDKMPISLCLFTVINDDNGNPVDFVYDYVNEAFLKFYKAKKEDFVGRQFFHIYPDADIKYVYFVWKAACKNEVVDIESFAHWCNKYLRHIFFPIYENVCGCIIEDNTVNHRMLQIIQNMSMGKAKIDDN